MKIKIGYFEKDGIKTQYWLLGKGKPLVFFVGSFSSPIDYSWLLKKLGQKFTVLAPAVPPFGQSDLPPQDWDFGNYADYFRSLINQTGLSRPYLAGYSFGGGIAANIAAQDKTIPGLILINSVGLPIKYPLIKGLFLLARMNFKKISSSKNRKKGIKRAGNFFIFVFKNTFRLKATWFLVRNTLGKDYNDLLNEIETPTLIIWSRDDEVLPVSSAYKLQKHIKGSHLQLVSGGHDWAFYYPEKLLDLITKFLAS